MPVTENSLTTGFSNTDASSYASASITPGANRLVLAACFNEKISALTTPTASGNGLTYVQVATISFNTIASPVDRVTVFRAMGASPSAGAVTFDFGGTNQELCIWSIVEFDGVDTTGTDGSGAVAGSATNSANNANSLTVTLGAASDATYGAFGIGGTNTFTAGTGFTALDATTATFTEIFTEWRSDGVTTVDCSWGGISQNAGGIAIAIKVASAAGATWPGWASSRGGWF